MLRPGQGFFKGFLRADLSQIKGMNAPLNTATIGGRLGWR
jgi:hypothetical protein